MIGNVAKLKPAAPILSAAVDEKRRKVVGGIYRLQNGDVEMVA
jgi:carbonic anhydrase